MDAEKLRCAIRSTKGKRKPNDNCPESLERTVFYINGDFKSLTDIKRIDKVIKNNPGTLMGVYTADVPDGWLEEDIEFMDGLT